MRFLSKDRRHLSRVMLLQHAESLVDAGKPVDSSLAAHVAGCAACAGEIEAIRTSLEVARLAPELEPLESLTAEILLRARNERQVVRAHGPSRVLPYARPVRRAVWAAAMCLIALSAGVIYMQSGHTPDAIPQIAQAAAMPSAEAIKKTAAEVHTLSAAMRAAKHHAEDPYLLARQRAVQAMDADIAAALAALERNPGCERAGRIVQSNLERQAQTLREMYASRGL